MIRINETNAKELRKYLNKFKQKNLRIISLGPIEIDMQLNYTLIGYDSRTGLIKFKSEKNNIIINLMAVDRIDITQDYKQLEIILEKKLSTTMYILVREEKSIEKGGIL